MLGEAGLPDNLRTKNPNLGKFWSALEWKILVFGILYIRPFWYILWSFGILYVHFGIFYGHLVYIVTIWYIFLSFGILCQEKSGNREKKNDSLKQISRRKKILPKSFKKSTMSFATKTRLWNGFNEQTFLHGGKHGHLPACDGTTPISSLPRCSVWETPGTDVMIF
jgi:hypothetical protein